MPYQGGEHLPGQAASKTSHIDVIESPLMRDLVTRFERREFEDDQRLAPWFHLDVSGVAPLGNTVASDGSLHKVTSEDGFRELCFVKTARFHLRTSDAAEVDPQFPHPLQIQRLMKDAAIHCNAVFPLRNMALRRSANVRNSVRELIREIITYEHGGIVYKAMKWLMYQGWGPESESPDLGCPHCHEPAGPFPYDADESRCRRCTEPIHITDVLGLHLDIGEDSATETVASAYMAIHEVLLLVAHLYRLWRAGNLDAIDDTLFVKDGPLMFPRQYATLTRRMREMLAYFKDEEGRNIYLVGQEKSGMLFDHLQSQVRHLRQHPDPDWPQVAILSHAYMRDRVQRMPKAQHTYGSRTNYGEKILVRLDASFALALNVPTGVFMKAESAPSSPQDFIGLERIIATLPELVSYLHEGSLVPINLAHGIASLSYYPSGTALQRFSGVDDTALPPGVRLPKHPLDP
ncbi:hypothetical protein [Glycomyces harbinensis]|uniref:NurA domain-containing protein n=1 Tax=Glycomyces harbinensis TaxID=58114 RepID=A0A1G6ZWX5_9ACTN|nr:hypothetical protein [Glycomyces harbinensis]SDE07082.1 hypothetical protein SAMN05216270_1129 [Glycomyces harbinensis]